MNYWPTFRSNYPANGAQLPPDSEAQFRSAIFFNGTGRHNKINQWTRPAERLLLVDATLWYLAFTPTDATGALEPQWIGRVVPTGFGASTIDRYRHGVYPRIQGTRYASTGGRVQFNAVFSDGHATSLLSYKDGYRAIRMRYP